MNKKTTQINYKLVAMKLGEGLKYETTLSEIGRNASVVFEFNCEDHSIIHITSERSQYIYDWVMTLSEQKIHDDKIISLLKDFIRMFDLPWDPYSELLGETGITQETVGNISKINGHESDVSSNIKINSDPAFIDSEKSRKIFVIHGRNEKARKALFQFLRAIDLEPLEWSQLIAGTGKGSPYIGEILESAFQTAQAVIVLMTGDDLAYIRDLYLGKDDKPEAPTPQARPNVLFEAGMAFGRNPDKTIIVELGKTRKYSDIEGRHVIRIDNTPEKRNALVQRLKKAGCLVKTEGKDDWYKDGDFDGALPPEHVEDDSPKEKLDIKEKMEYDGSVYWCQENSEGSGDKDGPFCPTCYDNNSKSIRLQKIKGDEYIETYWSCNVCNNNY